MQRRDDACCGVLSCCVHNVCNYNTIRTSKGVNLYVQGPLFLLSSSIHPMTLGTHGFFFFKYSLWLSAVFWHLSALENFPALISRGWYACIYPKDSAYGNCKIAISGRCFFSIKISNFSLKNGNKQRASLKTKSDLDSALKVQYVRVAHLSNAKLYLPLAS